MRLIGAMLVFAGCHPGGTETPDTLDPDGSAKDPGLFVRWRANPALPGSLSDKVSVSEATFHVFNFQVLGDAATDPRTAHGRYRLRWSAESVPEREEFYDAPAGVYSKISLNLLNSTFGEDTYDIHGTWRDGENNRRFHIEDSAQLKLSLAFSDTTLAAGGAVSLGIRVDLRDALGGIDFRNVPEDDGVLELHDGEELERFRARLTQSFTVER